MKEFTSPTSNNVTPIRPGQTAFTADWVQAAALLSECEILDHVDGVSWDRYTCNHDRLGSTVIVLSVTGECMISTHGRATAILDEKATRLVAFG